MAKLTDEDGIDGPFERRMARAIASDSQRTKPPLTGDTITAEHMRMLAKVRVAEHLGQRIKGKISRELSDLAYGKHSRVAYDQLRAAGFVGWDNGSVLTESGNAALDAILSARQAAKP